METFICISYLTSSWLNAPSKKFIPSEKEIPAEREESRGQCKSWSGACQVGAKNAFLDNNNRRDEKEEDMNYFRSRFQRQSSTTSLSTTNPSTTTMNTESVLRDMRRRRSEVLQSLDVLGEIARFVQAFRIFAVAIPCKNNAEDIR